MPLFGREGIMPRCCSHEAEATKPDAQTIRSHEADATKPRSVCVCVRVCALGGECVPPDDSGDFVETVEGPSRILAEN